MIFAFSATPLVLSGCWKVFLVGCFGGLLSELLILWDLRQTSPSDWSNYLKGWVYWAISFLMVIVGGGVTLLYGCDMTALEAIQLGISAPLFLRALATTKGNPPRID